MIKLLATLTVALVLPGAYPAHYHRAHTRHRRTASISWRTVAPVAASEYGHHDGTMGSGLACGGHLTESLLGVANRTLPCGTNVALHANGRTLVVPVVDRGPYCCGRQYDLTVATALALALGDDWSGHIKARVLA